MAHLELFALEDENNILLLFPAPVARMLKFYNIPLLTAGGFAFDFNKDKTDNETEFHMLVKTGISHTQLVNFTYTFFNQ